jgi:hypothetical protein
LARDVHPFGRLLSKANKKLEDQTTWPRNSRKPPSSKPPSR